MEFDGIKSDNENRMDVNASLRRSDGKIVIELTG